MVPPLRFFPWVPFQGIFRTIFGQFSVISSFDITSTKFRFFIFGQFLVISSFDITLTRFRLYFERTVSILGRFYFSIFPAYLRCRHISLLSCAFKTNYLQMFYSMMVTLSTVIEWSYFDQIISKNYCGKIILA